MEATKMKPFFSTNTLWNWVAWVFACLLTAYIFSPILRYHAMVMPSLSSDGGKNLFTYLFHILHDKGLHFSGMNYPYGEHIVFTDGQPLLSVPLSYLKGKITIENALVVLWAGIMLSYVVAIRTCTQILIHFKLPPWLAMLFGGLIVSCSPQIFRVSGHFALSYACAIPMLFYYTLQYHDLKKLKYPIYIFVSGTLFTFLHPYFSAMSLVWLGCYAVAYFITAKGTLIDKIKHLLPLKMAVVGVFLVFWVFMKITDPATDRPITPYGILEYCTRGLDIFTSSVSPYWQMIVQNTPFKKICHGGEGYAYTGWAVLTMLTLLIIHAPFVYFFKKKVKFLPVHAPHFSGVWVLVALFALLFSMGVPFVWNMDWLLDYASLLKQFRTLGRFVWIFYYIATIYGAVLAYHNGMLLLEQGKRVLVVILGVLFMAIWGYEAKCYIDTALMAVDLMMSRSRWGQTFEQVRIAGGCYTQKAQWLHGSDKRPLLLMVLYAEKPDPNQEYLISASTYIGHFDVCKLYACYPERLLAIDKAKKDSAKAIANTLRAGQDTCLVNVGTWYINHLDSCKADSTFFSTGAFPYTLRKEIPLIDVPIAPVIGDTPVLYEFSCWALVGREDYKTPYFHLFLYDSSGKQLFDTDMLTKESTDNNGLWLRNGYFFYMPPACRRVKCWLVEPDNAYKAIDETMIAPANATIISKDKAGRTMVNNHKLN
ncbi:MAG: hypothetical protein EBX41_00305 [Chitinophagia bacterium]|nr:hypothetical protein [Chitinophagia bacterium]